MAKKTHKLLEIETVASYKFKQEHKDTWRYDCTDPHPAIGNAVYLSKKMFPSNPGPALEIVMTIKPQEKK